MLQADEYMLPYSNLVGSDPSIEDMRLTLIVQGARPDIPMRWKCDNVRIIKLITKNIHFTRIIYYKIYFDFRD